MAVPKPASARSAAQTAKRPWAPPDGRPLPLENGDHLSRAEFERRYRAMPSVKRAELVEGVVHMPSPVTSAHGECVAAIIEWLGPYRRSTPGVCLATNVSIRLDADNEVQPDVVLRLSEEKGGRCTVSGDGFLEGGPELVAEVALSSASYDLHEKLRVYRRNGVQEYIIWRVYDEELDWLQMVESEYVPLQPDAEGVIRSRVFPGLRLLVPALLSGDMAAVLADLQKGISSEEHAQFVREVAERIS